MKRRALAGAAPAHVRAHLEVGGHLLEHAGEARERYLAAQRAADARDLAPPLEFVRSAA